MSAVTRGPMTGSRHGTGIAFRVALTFDAEHPDRPSERGIEDRLLDLLDERGTKASFFIQGRWAEAYPGIAKRIADAGHLVGNHSYYHARMPLLTQAGLRADLATAERAILAATGVDPRPYFRCPFGAGAEDRRVQAVIRGAGYRHIGWNVIGLDWPPERTVDQIERTIVDGALRRGDGAVVLLHAWPDRTLGALPGAIASLRERGASFARIDQLDRIPDVGGSVDEQASAT